MNVSAPALTDLTVRVLTNSNTSEDNAWAVADALVAAELDGLASHGVSRLPAYADQARSGKVDGQAVADVRVVAPSAVRVDARTGFAFPAIRRGLDSGLQCARDTGVAAVAVMNSHHFGVAGHHVERMANAGLVALGFGNAPAAIAPWGGARAVFGTNPIAFAAPRAERSPVVIDLSMSKVARGKVMVARQRGELIPEGWGLDADGHATVKPEAVLDGGTMTPAGGAKGAALALMVEILAAALTGAHFGFEASSFFTASGSAPRVGQFFLILDPLSLSGGSFYDRLEILLDSITEQPGARLPGDRRLATRARMHNAGIEVPDDLYSQIVRRAGAKN